MGGDGGGVSRWEGDGGGMSGVGGRGWVGEGRG